jgi:SAM-dependent methyltransferase
MIKENPWDKLSHNFNSHKKDTDIPKNVADNILIAWPPVIGLIEHHFGTRLSKKDKLKALDYGCGTGGFAQKLASLGFAVTGIDHSPKMIEVARSQGFKNITFKCDTADDLSGNYDLITGIMVFQFIDKIDEVIKRIVSRISPGGLLIFAVFNPVFIAANVRAGKISGFDKDTGLGDGYFFIGGTKINTYSRDVSYYDKQMSAHNFKKVMEEYPPFTDDFLTKHPVDFSVEQPEFMILGYA